MSKMKYMTKVVPLAFLCRAFALMTLVIGLSLPVWAVSEVQSGQILSQAMNSAKEKDWDAAYRLIDKIPDPAAKTLIDWQRLRDGEGSFDEYLTFLSENPDWPGLKRLRRKGEVHIPRFYRPSTVREYFNKEKPQTGAGALRLAEAYRAAGRDQDALEVIVNAWSEFPLSDEEETEFFVAYEGIISQRHRTRLNNMLWAGETGQAKRQLKFVDPAYQSLARARLALQLRENGVDQKISEVTEAFQSHPGLAFDRFEWRIHKGRWDEAEALILAQTTNAAGLGKPEAWGNRRRGFARRAMRAGRYEDAYILASLHGLKEGSDYADLEWLSGFIALEFLKQPNRALTHFKRFEKAVSSPISRARGHFWLARNYRRLGNTLEEKSHLDLAALQEATYYGQLAGQRLNRLSDIELTGRFLPVPNWRQASFMTSSVLRAALLLHDAGEPQMVRWFMAHMAETLPEIELVQLSDLALELEEPYVALGITKEAAKRGYFIPTGYFPLTDLAGFSRYVRPEIALSIARRESELNPLVTSPAGARGLMQIMPATAKQLASRLGLPYSKDRLLTDWQYNATLGTAYLAELLEKYNGSYLLAFAAYNAGPSRVEEWISRYGDPRDRRIDPVIWVEQIPFRETRNYVMRVMESLHVYQVRLSGQRSKFRLLTNLQKGG